VKHFYRAMLRRAQYCYGKSTVRLYNVGGLIVITYVGFFENNFTVS